MGAAPADDSEGPARRHQRYPCEHGEVVRDVRSQKNMSYGAIRGAFIVKEWFYADEAKNALLAKIMFDPYLNRLRKNQDLIKHRLDLIVTKNNLSQVLEKYRKNNIQECLVPSLWLKVPEEWMRSVTAALSQ